jgi:hypothetical protein
MQLMYLAGDRKSSLCHLQREDGKTIGRIFIRSGNGTGGPRGADAQAASGIGFGLAK